ncbi:MAG: hypothetical protein R3195_13545 [Gemmatimonadota bacterium]|nr:hypothetical protein [Gemmatimonadota bacterium]
MTNRRFFFAAALIAVAVQVGCASDVSTPLAFGPDDRESPFEAEQNLAKQVEGVYTGSFMIEVLPDSGFVGTCPGTITVTADGIKGALEGRSSNSFSGTYFIEAAGDCASGIPVTGNVTAGEVRDDGGVNFGMTVPGGDANLFEDILAGSGINFDQLEALGCTVVAGDIDNQMVGAIIANRMEAVTSAGLTCTQAGKDSDVGSTNQTFSTFAMRVSIDATR